MKFQKRLGRYWKTRYEILKQGERKKNDRIHRLFEVRIASNVSNRTKNRIIDSLIEENDAIGSIEWWIRGSIVYKPKRNFYLILILACAGE